jgi:hypothetical protein
MGRENDAIAHQCKRQFAQKLWQKNHDACRVWKKGAKVGQ